MSGGIPEVRGGGRGEPAPGPHGPWARTAVLPGRGGEEVWGPTCVRGCFMCGLAWGPCPRRPVSRAPRGEEGPAVCGPKRGPNLRLREGGPGCLPWFQGHPRALEGVSLGRGGAGVAFQQDPGVHRVRVGVLVSLRRAVLSAVLAPARNPEGECGSLTLFPGSKRRDMEYRYSLVPHDEVPEVGNSENQVEEGGSVPAAAGTLESAMLRAKRCGSPPSRVWNRAGPSPWLVDSCPLSESSLRLLSVHFPASRLPLLLI